MRATAPFTSKLNFHGSILLTDVKLTETQLEKEDAIKDVLTLGVTTMAEERCLGDFVRCTRVKAELPSCSTHVRGPRTAHHPQQRQRQACRGRQTHTSCPLRGGCGPTLAAPLPQQVRWVRGRRRGPCTHDFEQCVERKLRVPCPPPPTPPRAAAPSWGGGGYGQHRSHKPQRQLHCWYLGIPPPHTHFSGAFPVEEDREGVLIWAERAYMEPARVARAAVPQCLHQRPTRGSILWQRTFSCATYASPRRAPLRLNTPLRCSPMGIPRAALQPWQPTPRKVRVRVRVRGLSCPYPCLAVPPDLHGEGNLCMPQPSALLWCAYWWRRPGSWYSSPSPLPCTLPWMLLRCPRLKRYTLAFCRPLSYLGALAVPILADPWVALKLRLQPGVRSLEVPCNTYTPDLWRLRLSRLHAGAKCACWLSPGGARGAPRCKGLERRSQHLPQQHGQPTLTPYLPHHCKSPPHPSFYTSFSATLVSAVSTSGSPSLSLSISPTLNAKPQVLWKQ